MKKVLVIGRGGREHSICDALLKSKYSLKIFCAPGNEGTASIATNIDIDELDNARLVEFALNEKIDLTIVGPESSLMNGIADEFIKVNLRIFAPTQNSAIIEGSKQFAKDLMARHNIPTAKYETFYHYDKAVQYVKSGDFPIVIKYDGLAAGKGVVIAQDLKEAEETLKDMLVDSKFGQNKVVIEEFLTGNEFSLMALVNGDNVFPLAVARDHKRAYDNDTGDNTGGMGAFSPVVDISEDKLKYSYEHILVPTAKAMNSEGNKFVGVLYAGLIDSPNGIKVIEFNARFGDPETEVVLPRLCNDFYQVINDVLDGLNPQLVFSEQMCIGVVMASKGYPKQYENGSLIKLNGVSNVYHMGTKLSGDKLLTSGGRVLFVYGLGNDLNTAREDAYSSVEKIDCANLFYRNDIGKSVLK